MKRTWKIAALVLCASMMVTACAPGNHTNKDSEKKTEGQAPEEKEYQAKLDAILPSAYNNAEGLHLEKGSYISIIGKGDKSAYWQEVKKGVEQAAEDINAALGYEGKDKVKVTYNAPSNEENVDEQVNILDEELARYPVALGIACVDENACAVQFDLAAENEIPIIAFDSGSSYQGLLATVATNNLESAAVTADKLAEQIGEAGEVLIFSHSSKTKTGRERVQGFADQMKEKYPDVTVAGTYYLDDLDEMKKAAAAEINAGTWSVETENNEEEILPEMITEEQVVDYIFSKHPEAKGVYGTNINALTFAEKGLERQSSMQSTVLVGYDIDEEMLGALLDGKVDGILMQNPFGMGYAAVIAAARSALDMGNEAYVNTGYVWVTREHINDADIKKMMY